jgi:hypothetical protein
MQLSARGHAIRTDVRHPVTSPFTQLAGIEYGISPAEAESLPTENVSLMTGLPEVGR